VVTVTWEYDKDNAFRSWMGLVAATTWWPDTELRVGDLGGMNGLQLHVRHVTPDSRDPDRVVAVGHPHSLSTHSHAAGPKFMERHLQDILRRVAKHEADEWILIDGERKFDPHGMVQT
jgi:hypothetical protein